MEKTVEELFDEIDSKLYQMNLEIKISELEKIINFYEKNIYPYACYNPEFVIRDRLKVCIKIPHYEAISKLKNLKSFYNKFYYNEFKRRKIRETII